MVPDTGLCQMDVIKAYPQLTWDLVWDSDVGSIHVGTAPDACVLLATAKVDYYDGPEMQAFCDQLRLFWASSNRECIHVFDIRSWWYPCSLGALYVLRDLAADLKDVWEDRLLFSSLLLGPRMAGPLNFLLGFYTPVRPLRVTSELDEVLTAPPDDSDQDLFAEASD